MCDDPRYTRGEIKDCGRKVIIIDNVVYDLERTKFLDSHPGGAAVLLEQVGYDASQSFFEVGHSRHALPFLELTKIGELVDEDRWPEIGDKNYKQTRIFIPQYFERRRLRGRRVCTLKMISFMILGCAAAVIFNLFLYRLWCQTRLAKIK